jgi:membrane-bound lytic murein transglycosylase D
LILPWAWRVAGIAPAWGARVEIWNGPKAGVGAPAPARMSVQWLAAPAPFSRRLRSVPSAFPVAVGILGAGVLFGFVRWSLRRRRLGRLCLALPVVKRVGRVHVCASDHDSVPFAAHHRGVAFIVVPTALLADIARLRLVVAHEAHHHRRGDLRAASGLAILRAAFFWNPMLPLWERTIAELQDRACDRRVLHSRRVSPVAYGRTLLWAAEAAQGRRYVVLGARGITGSSPTSLKRRIVMLDQHQSDGGSQRVRAGLIGLGACALLLTVSWAVHGAVIDHRVSRSRVDALAARIQAHRGFPVLVDDQVVTRLNQWLAVPEKREAMTKAMQRMRAYRGMIEQTLHDRGLPVELLGVAMAESAFDNEAHPEVPVERRSVGIWQIVPHTGRQLGLAISQTADDRLEPRKATEAVATLLTRLHDRYRDWVVAIAAYNAGEKKIDALLPGAGTVTEARQRVLAGQDEHARYLRAVMASVILIDNPDLLQ